MEVSLVLRREVKGKWQLTPDEHFRGQTEMKRMKFDPIVSYNQVKQNKTINWKS